MRAAPYPPQVHCYVSLYRDAARARPYGARWKALWVSAPGDLTGQPVRNDRGDEMEFRSMGEAARHMAKRHGAVAGDLVRVFLPRYEGKTGFYAVPDRFFGIYG